MITRVAFTPRVRGARLEDLQREWRGEHAAVAAALPGLRAYVQNHALADLARPLPYPGFDVCAELSFDNAEAMAAAVESRHYRERIAPARPATIDMPRTRAIVAERHTLRAGEAGEGAVKLMTFLRGGADLERERLRELLFGEWAEALAALEPLRHEVLLEAGPADARGAVPFDAIDVLWLSDAGAAEAAVFGPVYGEARRALGLELPGSERIIARPLSFECGVEPTNFER